jgi:hypothetical protein
MRVGHLDHHRGNPYIPLRLSLHPRQAQRSLSNTRANKHLPPTRLVLIDNRFWYLPAPKPKNPRRARQIIAALAVVLIAGLVAANLLLFAAMIGQTSRSPHSPSGARLAGVHSA